MWRWRKTSPTTAAQASPGAEHGGGHAGEHRAAASAQVEGAGWGGGESRATLRRCRLPLWRSMLAILWPGVHRLLAVALSARVLGALELSSPERNWRPCLSSPAEPSPGMLGPGSADAISLVGTAVVSIFTWQLVQPLAFLDENCCADAKEQAFLCC
ncbi:PHD finger protein ING1 [Zea mays]|jgi:hypothetical protein|uniref:PHD finger protein ING1 n=1 Tax=Zea mays TaxID=4577 RepID=A0A1D6PJQ8_MAIZE|nr:PHD finger protein ING1 [Zea mays]